MTRRITLAALAAALLTPAAAQAGTPFTIGEGREPSVQVQADNGTAHVVWHNPTTKRVFYCQVPRSASTCAAVDLGNPTGDTDATFLLRENATTLHAIMPIAGSVYRRTSTTNGATWPGGWVHLYNGVASMGTFATRPIIGPAASEITVASSGGSILAADLNGAEGGGAADPDANLGGIGYDTQVAPIPGGKLVAVGNDLATTQFWRFTGTNPSLEAHWAGASTTIPGELDTTRVAGGPLGTFLFGSAGPVSAARQEIRRWNGVDNFGPPVVLANEIGYINDVTVGPSGVAAIWRANEPSGGNRLKLALSGDGTNFTVTTIAREDAVMDHMAVSLASDNGGFAAYEGNGSGATAPIRMVDLTAVPDPVVTPPPAGGTPTPAPAPAPIVLPKPVASLTKKTTVPVKGATITLQAPRQCIPSGRPFVATLSWKKQRRKGNLFVKVRRTDFYIGTKRLKIDKKAPFRQTLRIPNPKKGQTYRLRARAFIKVKRGKAPKKSVVTTLKVCA